MSMTGQQPRATILPSLEREAGLATKDVKGLLRVVSKPDSDAARYICTHT